MIGWLVAAALAQAPAPAAGPCYAVANPPGQAGCPTWRELRRAAEGALSVDPASLRRAGSAFEIQVRFVYDEAGAGVIRSIVTAFRFDCGGRTVAMGRGHAYDAAGVMLDEEEPREDYTPPAPVAPGAPEAAVLAAYCPH